MGVDVRPAKAEELPAVLNVLDGAALETDYERVRDRVPAGDILVAVPDEDPDRILGACVLDGTEIVAIAVRRRRRDQGIGRELIARAARDRDRLRANFDADVSAFYEALGFDVTPIEGGRYRGVLEPAEPEL